MQIDSGATRVMFRFQRKSLQAARFLLCRSVGQLLPMPLGPSCFVDWSWLQLRTNDIISASRFTQWATMVQTYVERFSCESSWSRTICGFIWWNCGMVADRMLVILTPVSCTVAWDVLLAEATGQRALSCRINTSTLSDLYIPARDNQSIFSTQNLLLGYDSTHRRLVGLVVCSGAAWANGPKKTKLGSPYSLVPRTDTETKPSVCAIRRREDGWPNSSCILCILVLVENSIVFLRRHFDCSLYARLEKWCLKI